MRRDAKAILVVAAATAAMALTAVVGATDTAPPTTATKIKPDLIVASVKAQQTGIAPEGAYRVRVYVRVGLSAAGNVSTGAFKVKLEYRDAPLLSARRMTKSLGTWTFLQQAGIAGMTYSIASSRMPGETRTFDDTVPPGVVRTYRATVDSMDQVDEADESNNQGTDSFRADGCAGVDLVVQRVELRRSARGAAGKIWVKNRCLATCDGSIEWVAGLEGGPAWAVEAYPLATGLGGEAVVESANYRVFLDGSVVVDPASVPPPEIEIVDGPEVDQTWIFRVWANEPGCPETNTGNNSCRATLRAGQDSVIVNCR